MNLGPWALAIGPLALLLGAIVALTVEARLHRHGAARVEGILWWLLGAFLLTLTPLPAHTDTLGWTPLYWLLLAPPCMLAGLRLRRLAFASPAG